MSALPAISSRYERGSPDWLADQDDAYESALAAMESRIKDALSDEGSDVDGILLDEPCSNAATAEFAGLVRQAAWWKSSNEQLGLALRVYVQNMVERAARESVERA